MDSKPLDFETYVRLELKSLTDSMRRNDSVNEKIEAKLDENLRFQLGYEAKQLDFERKLTEKFDERYAPKTSFSLVQGIVFKAIALILTAFLGALLVLVIKR